MIYVIESLAFVDPNKGFKIDNIKSVIKIGFAQKLDKRLKGYNAHNLVYKVLFKIGGGTQKDEHKLHKYFKDLKVSYAREWFWKDESNTIISFFNKYSNIKSIRNAIRSVKVTKNNDYDSVRLSILRLNQIWKLRFPTVKEKLFNITFIETFRNKINTNYIFNTAEDFYNWFKNEVDFEVDSNIIESLIAIPEQYKEEVELFFDDFDRLKNLRQKLKYFCEYQCEDDLRQVIYNQITEKHFYEYIDILGPEILKKDGYNITKITKRLDLMKFNKTELTNKIHSSFVVGNKYLFVTIKSELGKIYNEYNYSKVPKATDIKNYFNTKKVKMTSPTSGKRIDAYIILGIK